MPEIASLRLIALERLDEGAVGAVVDLVGGSRVESNQSMSRGRQRRRLSIRPSRVVDCSASVDP